MDAIHFNRLRTFTRVVDCASFSGAARTLNLTQPAVSQQIKALEDALGTPLLIRSTEEVRPTPAGRLVYEQAVRIMQQWDELVEQVNEMTRNRRELVVGSSTVPATYVLGDVLYRFRENVPGTEVTVKVGDSTLVWDWVRDGVVDVGVTGTFRPVPGVQHRPIARDTIVLIAPCSHPWAGRTIAPAELQHVPLLWRAAGSGTRQVVEEAFARWGIDPAAAPRAGELGSTEAVVSAVAAGVGLSFVSSFAAGPALTLNRVCTVEVEGDKLERQFYFIYKSSRAGEPLLASFLATACEHAAEAR